jgi:hypothetical protein
VGREVGPVTPRKPTGTSKASSEFSPPSKAVAGLAPALGAPGVNGLLVDTKSHNGRGTIRVDLLLQDDWKAATDAPTQSMELRKGGDSNDWFFLAMAHWHLGDKPQACSWYEKAVPWMDKNQPKDEELIRFRAEAAAFMGVKEKTN